MTQKQQKQHNKKALLDALEKSLGIVSTACSITKLNRATFYRYKKDDNVFSDAVDDIQNVSLDFVESQLLKQIKKGSTAATIFYLKTKGKKRGYTEQVTALDKESELNINVSFDDSK